jgi:hypothetical protein
MRYVFKSAYDRNEIYVTSFNQQLRSPNSRYAVTRENSLWKKRIQIQRNIFRMVKRKW